MWLHLIEYFLSQHLGNWNLKLHLYMKILRRHTRMKKGRPCRASESCSTTIKGLSFPSTFLSFFFPPSPIPASDTLDNILLLQCLAFNHQRSLRSALQPCPWLPPRGLHAHSRSTLWPSSPPSQPVDSQLINSPLTILLTSLLT